MIKIKCLTDEEILQTIIGIMGISDNQEVRNLQNWIDIIGAVHVLEKIIRLYTIYLGGYKI